MTEVVIVIISIAILVLVVGYVFLTITSNGVPPDLGV